MGFPVDEQEQGNLAQACERLGIPPYTLRMLRQEYATLLSGDPADGFMPDSDVELLRRVLKLRDEGYGTEETLARLQAAAAGEPQSLDAELAKLAASLARAEQIRRSDRDMLLTALMRTQQELQQLRHELATRERRQARKKKQSLWARLWDF